MYYDPRQNIHIDDGEVRANDQNTSNHSHIIQKSSLVQEQYNKSDYTWYW